MESHVGPYNLIRHVDLDVVVAVIGIDDIVNGKLDYDAAFLDFNIMAALFLGHGTEIIHGLAELSVAQRLNHIIKSADLISLQGKIRTVRGENDGALVVVPPDVLRNPDSGGLPLQVNVNENKVEYIPAPGVKKVSGSIKNSRLLANMCVREISVYKTGQMTRLIN